MKKLWVSCPKFTVQVNTDLQDIIVWAAPFTNKFIGQHISNLTKWAARFGQVTVETI